MEEIVAELRQISPGDDSLLFLIRVGSVLINQMEERIAYMARPLTPAEKAAMCGELAGLRVALGAFRWTRGELN